MSTVERTSLPLRNNSTHLVQKELGGELLLCDLKTKKAFSLNQAAAVVWMHSDGNTSIDELAQLVAQATGMQADQRVVEFALRTLKKKGLMEQAELPASGDANLGRRQFFRKLGWGAALMMAAPAVLALEPRPDQRPS
jgi:ferric-dicitrate binding protein FerR (iron transport regulator)